MWIQKSPENSPMAVPMTKEYAMATVKEVRSRNLQVGSHQFFFFCKRRLALRLRLLKYARFVEFGP